MEYLENPPESKVLATELSDDLQVASVVLGQYRLRSMTSKS